MQWAPVHSLECLHNKSVPLQVVVLIVPPRFKYRPVCRDLGLCVREHNHIEMWSRVARSAQIHRKRWRILLD